jgi:hypothetical protein
MCLGELISEIQEKYIYIFGKGLGVKFLLQKIIGWK